MEKLQLRDQYSKLQNELEKQHLINIERRRQAKEQCKQQLDDLQKRYQEIKLAERERRNQQPKILLSLIRLSSQLYFQKNGCSIKRSFH